MKLKGKKVLVTGGSRGLGQAICIALASEGADIAFTYHTNNDAAQETIAQIAHYGFEVLSFKCDVRDREKFRKILKDLNDQWGCIDVLVNNAGINKPEDFDKITDDDWDEVFSVNLKGPFVTSQEAFPFLKKSSSASIINIGSVSGQYGGPRTAHYAASKAGLISLGQVIARFGADSGIRCNTISAGLIASDMGNEGLKSSVVAKAAESIILKRFGSFDEVAKVAVFLASNDSSYVTAQTINVNGGLYF
jgi:3-oxoacyl-[acyl-carrier protein] reductase